MKIYTDNKWKNFKYGYEVPGKNLRIDFDYLDEDERYDGFILYRGYWYHIADFMQIGPGAPPEFQKWDGYKPDSFFSGVLIKVSEDGEQYKIATYIS